MNRDTTLMRHFGLNPHALYWGERHEDAAQRIRDAVEGRRLLGVIGGFGMGKSELVRQALADLDNLDQVYINQPDKERLRVGHVMAALVVSLSGESPRRDAVARTFQLARLLGERVVVQRRQVAVVIENAHRLHPATLLALKDLRESAIYRGVVPLFSLILVGQEGLRARLERYGEVRYRTRTLELSAAAGWMDYEERRRYLTHVYGRLIEERTRDRLAALFTTPLELDHFIEGKLELMRDAGLDVLDQRFVPLSIREQRQALGISQRELERLSGVPKSTISDLELAKTDNEEARQAVLRALDDLAAERARPAVALAS